MANELIPPASELERETLELVRSLRSAALWTLPILNNDDVPVALDISLSAWENIKASGTGPRLFKVGVRLFASTADLRAWLNQLAGQRSETHPKKR